MKRIIIAIDGLSSSGKSTLAKHLARELNYRYIDSGAYYRAVALVLIKENVNGNDEEALRRELDRITVGFTFHADENRCEVLLNGTDVEQEIRSLEVSQAASRVSSIPLVRNFVTGQLRNTGKEKGIVMDGRDIGTVVFPEAELKIYLTAESKVRSERRFKEMKSRGTEVTESQIERNLSGRDWMDTTRSTAPLKKAEDAIELDNSEMNQEEQLNFVLKLAKEKMK